MSRKSVLALLVIFLLSAAGCTRTTTKARTRDAESYVSVPGSVSFDIQPSKSENGLLRYRAEYTSQGKLAKFVIEFGSTCPLQSGDSEGLSIKAGHGRFVAESGSDASVLLADLQKALEAKAIPARVKRAETLSFEFVDIGDNLSQAPNGGFNVKPPGHWSAIKIFLGKGDQEGEVFVNINTFIGKGQFSIKDPDYGDIVVKQLAAVL